MSAPIYIARPWLSHGATTVGYEVEGRFQPIAECSGLGHSSEEAERTAAQIVEALNGLPELCEVLDATANFLGGAKDRLGRPDPSASDDMRQARERIRELALRYGVAGGHHTYIDQCAALLNAAAAKAAWSAS